MSPNEIREEFARIRQRYEGVCDAIAPIRVSRLEAIEKHIVKLEADATAPKPCPDCGMHSNLFEPKDRDDSQYVSQQFGRIAACLADEARLMGEGLMTTAGKAERGCL